MPAVYRPTLLMGLNLGLTATCLVSALIWAKVINFGLPPLEEYVPVFYAAAGFVAVGLFYGVVRVDEGIARSMLSIATLLIAMPTIAVLTYLSVTLRFPLIDSALVAFDRAIGFDWLALIQRSLDYPLVLKYFRLVYSAPYVYFPFLVIVLLFASRRADMLEEMIGFFLFSAIITLVVAAVAPALPAYAYFQVPLDISARIGTPLDMNFGPTYFALRDGIERSIDLNQPRALVAFPSHHSIIAVMLSLYVRHNRYLLALMLPVTLSVLAATLVIGGHYLADTLGGIATALFSFCLVRRLSGLPLRLPRSAGARVAVGQGASG